MKILIVVSALMAYGCASTPDPVEVCLSGVVKEYSTQSKKGKHSIECEVEK